MSTLDTWADHIIIQAVANKHNLRINITESAPNFSESTIISSIYTGSEARRRNIYIGHLDELHYVSTTPITGITQSVSAELINHTTTSDKPSEILRNSQSNKTSLKEAVSTKSAEKRKQYMKKYMEKKERIMNSKRRKSKEKSYIMKTIKIPKPRNDTRSPKSLCSIQKSKS